MCVGLLSFRSTRCNPFATLGLTYSTGMIHSQQWECIVSGGKVLNKISQHIGVVSSTKKVNCRSCGLVVPRGRHLFVILASDKASTAKFCARCIRRISDEIDILLNVIYIDINDKIIISSRASEEEGDDDEES